jgi:hypothetical protein
MGKVHCIDLAYPIDGLPGDGQDLTAPWGRFDRELDELAVECRGHNICGGTGFGVRDLTFEFPRRHLAKKFRKLVSERIGQDEFEYLSYYSEG